MNTDTTPAAAPQPATTPRRRGRPRLRPLPDPTAPPRPRGRPRRDGLAPGTAPDSRTAATLAARAAARAAAQVAPAPAPVAPLDSAITDNIAINANNDDNTRGNMENTTRENTDVVDAVDVVNKGNQAGKSEKIDIGDIIAQREKALEKAISGICGSTLPARASKVCRLILATADGAFWEDAAAGAGIAWPTWGAYLKHHPLLREIWAEAQAAGESWRAQHLERVTFDRATSGWEEPVFHKGAICGHVRRFSDRLAEIHLRASNPARFAPSPGESGAGAAQTIIIHMDSPQVAPAIPTASVEVDPAAIPSRNQ